MTVQSSTGKEAGAALANDRKLDGIALETQAEFTPAQVRVLREFLSDLFDAEPQPSADARALGRDAQARTKALLAELERLVGDAARYPFLATLVPLAEAVRPIADMLPAWFLTDLDEATRERLVDARERLLDPVQRWENQGHVEYDAALALLGEEAANLDHVDAGAVAALREALAAPDAHRGDGVRRLRDATHALRGAIDAAVTGARAQAVAAIEAALERLRAWSDFLAAPEAARERVATEGAAAVAGAQAARGWWRWRASAQGSFATELGHGWSRCWRRLRRWRRSPLLRRLNRRSRAGRCGTSRASPRIPRSQRLHPQPRRNSLGQASFASPSRTLILADEGDLEGYLSALRRAMSTAIGEGKRIIL